MSVAHRRTATGRPRLVEALRTSWQRGALRTYRLVALLYVATGAILALVWLAPDRMPFTSLMVPLLVGSLLLNPRQLPWFVCWVAVMVCGALSQQIDITARTMAAGGIQLLM
ncbi:MAG: serine/threonine-protein phosphatase, partial [Actinobacteria bacterium]|nr:serine/threonine-protein phosphatase [Actinomycetota bacterium]